MPNEDAVPISKNELERQDRLKSVRRRRMKKVIIWIVVLAVLAAAVYGIVFWSKKAAQNKPGESVAELGREHIPVNTPRPEYNSNPPTSGAHYAQPSEWGVYDHELPDEQLVHNLEHGGIWISYKDPADGELVSQLKGIADDFTLKVILTPRAANDSRIAVAAWGRLLKLETFEEGQIRDFISAFINRGPEQVPY